MAEMEEDVHRADLGEKVDLFTLDLTAIGGGIHYFTTSIEPGEGTVQYQGNTYIPLDLMIDGIEYSGKGVLPQPTLKMANISRALTGQVADLDDLVGATVTRIRTLSKYLDGKPEANPNAHFPPDVFRIAQKSMQNKLLLEFTLGASIDVEGQRLPGRLVTRNYCKRTYRTFNEQNNDYNYEGVQCPYRGTAAFDRNGNVTTPDKDVCGKNDIGCTLRFGNDPLPTWAFFGAGRFGT